MKTAKRRIVSVIVGLALLISAMLATTISASAVTITPVTPTYPMTVSVVFISPSGTLQDKWGNTYTITGKNYEYEDVTYTSSFTTLIPDATTTNHALYGYPSVLDAIYSAYGMNNGSYSGWHNGWDTDPATDPWGSYVDKMFNNPEVTLYYTSTMWKGYSWQLYMNTYSTNDTWNASTSTGKLPYYGSDIQIKDGDVIVCRYMYTEEPIS